MKRKIFSEFAFEVNKDAILRTDVKYAYLVYSYENFLKNMIIKSHYMLGNKEKALELALVCFDDNLFDDQATINFEFDIYVDCIVSDKKLSADEKTDNLKQLALLQYRESTVLDWLGIEFLNAKEGAPDEGIYAIIYLEVARQICDVQIQLLLAVDSETDISAYEEEKILLLEMLNTLWENY